jgi:hypothetical protein
VIRGGTARTHSVDNIYLGNNSPFVPEPASLALLGLGGVMMLGRRRRQA